MPAQAKENTPEGAAAFARHFVVVLSSSIEASTAGRLDDLSSEGCQGCLAYEQIIEQDRAAGRELVGFGWTVSRVDVFDNLVHLNIEAQQYRTRENPSDTWATVGGAKHRLVLQLEYVDQSWIVGEMFTDGAGA